MNTPSNSNAFMSSDLLMVSSKQATMSMSPPPSPRSSHLTAWKPFLVAIFVLLIIVVMSAYNDYRGVLKSFDSFDSNKQQQEYVQMVQNTHFEEKIPDSSRNIDNEADQFNLSDEKTHNSSRSIDRHSKPSALLVEYEDYIYENSDWDAAPVILENYKLAFFTIPKVGCTTWKQMFRRMMGYSNWAAEEYEEMLPWNPETNGLKYLYDFPIKRANEIMTSPEWTRAIFVRDPKERLVSAYLDKGVGNPDYMRQKCCGDSYDCIRKASESLKGFLGVATNCENAHWSPQAKRMEEKYWPYINYVGHMESITEDAKSLLRLVGAWQRYGASGWGKDGKYSIFQTKAGGIGRHHATNAQKKLKTIISSTTLEREIEDYYAEDFLNPVLNFTNYHLYNNQANADNA